MSIISRIQKDQSISTPHFEFDKSILTSTKTCTSLASYCLSQTFENVKKELNVDNNYILVVNNDISVNSFFINYANNNNIEIRSIINQSVITWKNDENVDEVVCQGIFEIILPNFFFYHACVFQKGSSFEDELVFFVLVHKDDYEKYLAFRDTYNKWQKECDRNSNEIHIVSGENKKYDLNAKWEDLFLEEEVKQQLKFSIESFLENKDFYDEKSIPWKKGIILHGPPGCGKTSIIRTIISNYNVKPVTLGIDTSSEVLQEAFMYAEENSPSLLFIEDLDSLIDRTIELSIFLNLMDGVTAKNGMLIICTANDLKALKPSITSRPSRFDRKFHIPLPNLEMSLSYLKKWFKNDISDEKLKKVSSLAVKNKLSYAYLKEIYISSAFNMISKNSQKITDEDIDLAVKVVLSEKKVSSTSSVSTDKYFEE